MPAEPRPWWRRVAPTVPEAGGLVAVIGGWVAWRTRVVNYGDLALIEMRTRDVFSRHPPFTGAFSRWDWAHPGPLYEQLVAVPYRLGGTSATALRFATVALSVAWLAVLWWLVRRAGTVARAAVAVAVLGVFASRGGLLAADIWNPSVAVLPLLVTLVAGWRWRQGLRGAGWVGLLAGSFCVQAHLGYAAVIASVLVVVVAQRWREVDGGGSRVHAGVADSGMPADSGLPAGSAMPEMPARGRRPRVAAILAGHGRWGVAALVAAWAMPVLDSVFHPPGNLARIARFVFTGADGEERAGLGVGLRAVLRASSVSWPWQANDVTFLATLEVGLGVLPGTLIVLALAARLTIGRRPGPGRAALDVALAAWLGALVAAASITGLRYVYLTYWFHAVVWFTWVAVVATIGVAAGEWLAYRGTPSSVTRLAWMPPAATVVARLAQVGLAVVVVAEMLSTELVPRDQAAAVVGVAAEVQRVAPAGAVEFTVDSASFAGNDVTAGAFNLLDRRGRDVRWPGMAAQVGDRRARPGAAAARFLVVDADRAVPAGSERLGCWALGNAESLCLYRAAP